MLKAVCTVAIGAAASFAVPAGAAVIAEVESGNTRATAQSLDASFTPNANPNVFGTDPTVTVNGSLAVLNDADWYSFAGQSGSVVNVDIDDTELLFDTYLGLFNSAGTLIAISDDTFGPTDPGSAPRSDTNSSSRASFIGAFTLPTTGTYYISVTDYGNRPANRSGTGVTQDPLTRPDGVTLDDGSTASLFNNSAIIGATVGNDALLTSTSTNLASRTGTYTLHVSASAVPEPAALSLLAVGALGLLSRRRSRA